MTCTKLPNGNIFVAKRVRLPDGTRYRLRETLSGVTMTAARAWEQKMINGLTSGEIKPKGSTPDARSFSDFLDDWFKVYPKEAGNKASSIRAKDVIIRTHLKPAFGSLTLQTELKDWNRAISDFKAALATEDYANKTINCILTVLNRAWESALDWGYVEVKPRIKLLKVVAPIMEFWDRSTHQAIYDAAKADHDPRAYPMVLLAMNSGLRLGELEALEWPHLDSPRCGVQVQKRHWYGDIDIPKGNSFRFVPIPKWVMEAVLNHTHKRRVVFSNPDDGSYLAHSTAGYMLHRVLERAKLPPAGWHKFRHTFGTMLAKDGVNARTIQAWMGHESIRQTDQYMHFAPSELQVNPLLPGQPVANDQGGPPKIDVNSTTLGMGGERFEFSSPDPSNPSANR